MACSITTKMETHSSSSISLSAGSASSAGASISSTNTPTDYKLYDKWTLWAHLPHDTNWTFESYIRILTFDTAEAIIMLLETIPEEMTSNCMLFIMREGIKPMWEDPKNKKGG